MQKEKIHVQARHLRALLEPEIEPVHIEGLVVPAPTPFATGGSIDERAFVAHLEFLAQHGVHRILVNGTTSEFFSLLPKERRQMLAVARRYFPGMILANTGSDSLALARNAARWSEDLGADALVAMTPYYYAEAGEQGLIEFFHAIAEDVDTPWVLYNFSRHTGNPLTPAILRAVPHLALKDSSNDSALLDATPCYLAGTSTRMLTAAKAGARGFVCALANVWPDRYVQLENAIRNNDPATAQDLSADICRRAESLHGPNEIAAIKHALSQRIPGYPPGVRLPLISHATH